MFNELLILKSFWSHNLELAFVCLIAWPISCYVSVQVHQFSVSVQNLIQHLSKIYLKNFKYQNLLKSQNLLNFPGIFGSSRHSAEVPDFVWKFWTFCRSSRHSSEVPDFLRKFRTFSGSSRLWIFPSHIQHTPSSLISPKSLLSTASALLSLSHALLSLNLKSQVQIYGSSVNLRKFGFKSSKSSSLHSLGHPIKESRYFLVLL